MSSFAPRSETTTTSAFSRAALRSPTASDGRWVPTSRWMIWARAGSWTNSIGLSSVRMGHARVRFPWSTTAAVVVVFPFAAGPATTRRPERCSASRASTSGAPSSESVGTRAGTSRNDAAIPECFTKRLTRNRAPFLWT